MNKLLSMDRSVLDLAAFRAAQQKFESVMAEMQQYEAALVEDWCSQVCTAQLPFLLDQAGGTAP
jgi:hypothetical protein